MLSFERSVSSVNIFRTYLGIGLDGSYDRLFTSTGISSKYMSGLFANLTGNPHSSENNANSNSELRLHRNEPFDLCFCTTLFSDLSSMT